MPKPINGTDECPEERDSNRIRAFLARVIPLVGCEVADDYWEARSLIEQLALAYETEDESYHWDHAQIAMVLDFMHWIQPAKGTCWCDDDSRINATCGLHAVLEFMAEEVRGLGRANRHFRADAAPKTKGRKRALEGAYG
jgi:hypothetical protein